METDRGSQQNAHGENKSAEMIVANAIIGSLLALKLDSEFLYKTKPDLRQRLEAVFRLSISFMNLLQSRAEKQSVDIFSDYEQSSQDWPERLPRLIREKGLDRDQEILAAAQEFLPYGNDLIEVAEKLFSDKSTSSGRESLLGHADLPGDPTTDAPPPRK